jgi:hypothetical protein
MPLGWLPGPHQRCVVRQACRRAATRSGVQVVLPEPGPSPEAPPESVPPFRAHDRSAPGAGVQARIVDRPQIEAPAPAGATSIPEPCHARPTRPTRRRGYTHTGCAHDLLTDAHGPTTRSRRHHIGHVFGTVNRPADAHLFQPTEPRDVLARNVSDRQPTLAFRSPVPNPGLELHTRTQLLINAITPISTGRPGMWRFEPRPLRSPWCVFAL